jgi:hypothetical protein
MCDDVKNWTLADREEVARAAYLLWERHRYPTGRDREFWLQAGRKCPFAPMAALPSRVNVALVEAPSAGASARFQAATRNPQATSHSRIVRRARR